MDSKAFLELWHQAMFVGMIIVIALGVIIYLVYSLRSSMINDPKEKHDFINKNEIKWYKYTFFCFGIAFAMWVNTYNRENIFDLGIAFFVRIFFSVAAATLIGYVASLILD